MSTHSKNFEGEPILLGNEELLSQFPEITDLIPSLAIHFSSMEIPAMTTARFLPNGTYSTEANGPFSRIENAFLDSGTLTAHGPNAYTFTNIARLETKLRFNLDFLNTISASDRESFFSAATTASRTDAAWVYVAISNTSATLIGGTKEWSSLTNEIRKTGSRLCVVDLRQWRDDFKSTSSYRVKI